MKIKLKPFLVTACGLIMLAMLLFYNHKRIHAEYLWGFGDKYYSFNLIPFNEIGKVLDFDSRFFTKIAFFIVIGVLLNFLLTNLYCTKIRYYLIFSLAIIVFLELLVSFTSGFLPVPIDANNFIFYLVGLTIGFGVWKLLVCIYNTKFWRKIFY